MFSRLHQKDSPSSWHYLPPIPLFVCWLIIGEIAKWSTPSMIALMLGEDRRGWAVGRVTRGPQRLRTQHLSHSARRCKPPLQSASTPVPGAPSPWDNTVYNPISYILLHPWRRSDLDSLGQGNVSLVVHSEADAWGSATGKEEEGDPAEGHD